MTKNEPYKKEFIKFISYLNKVDITTRVLLKRIEFIYTLFGNMFPDEIEDVFITEYVKEDGTREYENFWVFSKGYCGEAKKFLNQVDLDITPIKNRITYWTVQANDYDFKKATVKSRLNLYLETLHNITCDFKATRGNCGYLQSLINKYVKPNIVPL